jgi:hypothetical protein
MSGEDKKSQLESPLLISSLFQPNLGQIHRGDAENAEKRTEKKYFSVLISAFSAPPRWKVFRSVL